MEEKNEQDIEAKRAEAAEELRAAFAELESDEGLTRFIGGHGVQSRIFEFEWSEPALEISFHIPYARVLSDEESQKEDDEEIGAAIRMAILLLTTAGGELEDSGTDWSPLVRRLGAELDNAPDSLSIIWP